jgi:hypothetical protein
MKKAIVIVAKIDCNVQKKRFKRIAFGGLVFAGEKILTLGRTSGY